MRDGMVEQGGNGREGMVGRTDGRGDRQVRSLLHIQPRDPAGLLRREASSMGMSPRRRERSMPQHGGEDQAPTSAVQLHPLSPRRRCLQITEEGGLVGGAAEGRDLGRGDIWDGYRGDMSQVAESRGEGSEEEAVGD